MKQQVMKINKITNRNILYTNETPWGWDINIQLIRGEKNNYIIDTGLGSLNIQPVINDIKLDSKPIIIINTHYHWDHIWGNGAFENSTIVSHKLCRKMIELNWDEMIEKNRKHIQGEVTMCLPNITFDNELYFPEDNIRLIYTPGHTIDSISVLDEIDNVIHIGDNIGESMDELIPSLYCEKEYYRSSLLKYREMDFEVCVSGHHTVVKKPIIEEILSRFAE